MRSLRLVLVLISTVLDGVNRAIALADTDGKAVGVARVDDEVVSAGRSAKGCQSRSGAD